MAAQPQGGRLFPIAMVGAVLAISVAAICFRKAQPTHPLVASAIRLGLAALLLAPFTIRAHLRGTLPWRPALLGALCYAVHFGAWVTSLGLTSVAASVTLVTATPLLLGVWGAVTGRDAPDRRLWFALALAAVGVTIIGGTDLFTHPDAIFGDGLALLGAAAMAGYLGVARRLGPTLDVPAFQGAVVALAALILAATAALQSVPLVAASPRALLWLAVCALVPQIIGHGLLTWALRHRGPAAVGMVTVGEPVGATLLAVLFLGDRVSASTLGGCALSVIALAISLGRSGTRR